MFTIIPLAAIAIASAITGVQGHGFVTHGEFGGKTYPGWNPDTDPYAEPAVTRIFRKIPNDGPVTYNSPDLGCNVGGKTGAALVAKAAAGSQVTITMNRWPDDHKGPVIQYMASCNGDCTKFDATQAQWFKIYEDGYDGNVWASDKLIQNGLSVTSTIPADLAPGQYLFRHEMIALHSAGAPQNYPSCAQLEITGSGTQKATGKELVSMPGVYDNSDILTVNIWSDGFKSTGFTLPSPPVASLASSGGSNNSSPAPSSSAPAGSSPSSSSAATRSASASTASPTDEPPSATASPSDSYSMELPASSSTASPGVSSTVETPAPSSTGTCRRRLRRQSNFARHNAAVAKRHH